MLLFSVFFNRHNVFIECLALPSQQVHDVIWTLYGRCMDVEMKSKVKVTFPSAHLAFRFCRPLSLTSLKHLWFRFRTCAQMCFRVQNITHWAVKGLSV